MGFKELTVIFALFLAGATMAFAAPAGRLWT
jgi:hypothetical protein